MIIIIIPLGNTALSSVHYTIFSLDVNYFQWSSQMIALALSEMQLLKLHTTMTFYDHPSKIPIHSRKCNEN